MAVEWATLPKVALSQPINEAPQHDKQASVGEVMRITTG